MIGAYLCCVDLRWQQTVVNRLRPASLLQSSDYGCEDVESLDCNW